MLFLQKLHIHLKQILQVNYLDTLNFITLNAMLHNTNARDFYKLKFCIKIIYFYLYKKAY